MSDDEKSRLEVILEDINGKFGLVPEGHATLERMIHEHRAETRQDKRELQALIKSSHDSLDTKIEETNGRLDAKIDKVATALKEEIREVGNKVEGHEQRIQRLERKVA